MPRKPAQKSVVSTDDVQAVAQVAPVEVKDEVRREAKEAKKSKPKEVVVKPVQEVPAPETVSDSSPKRRVPTLESVQADFDSLLASVTAEVESLRKTAGKPKGVRFLLSVNKAVRKLKNHVQRVAKHRPRTRRNNTNSGFLKPVLLSKELATFTGWDQNVPRSRVDVTKFICNYIAEHKLQNPENRKHIRVETDPKLNALLKWDGGKEKKELDYCKIQSCLKLQKHFLPVPTETVAPVVPTTPVVKEAVVKPSKVKKSTA